jgi:hypothetical protein
MVEFVIAAELHTRIDALESQSQFVAAQKTDALDPPTARIFVAATLMKCGERYLHLMSLPPQSRRLRQVA